MWSLCSSDVELLQQFYRESGVFGSMLSLEETLDELSDFSSLWLRELYLEIARCPQFPTETSLPWLMMENCLKRQSSELGQKAVLSIVDIYNDAANCSLFQLRRQVLFDEAESEGKLCFDQLVYSLGEQVYAHCKREAQRLVLERIEALGPDGSITRPMMKKTRSKRHLLQAACPAYEWISQTKRVELFGESYNLTYLLSQHVHDKVVKSLEKWFGRLESSDAASVLDSWNSLQVLKKAHELLARLIPLDDFDDILHDIDSQIPVADTDDETLQQNASSSRLQAYASQILLLDLFQHYSYNALSGCFQRVPLPLELLSCVPNPFADAESSEPTHRSRRVAASAASPRSRLPVGLIDHDLRGLFGCAMLFEVVRPTGTLACTTF